MIKITEQTFDKERALYALQDAEVIKCVFSGEADGESPLKETRGLNVTECEFGLRYALWHSRFTSVTDSKFLDTCRAPLWYCSDVKIAGCTFSGVKALRECADYVVDIFTPHYGTDGDASVAAGYDIRHAAIGPGTLNSHGYERTHIDGLKNTFILLAEYIGAK